MAPAARFSAFVCAFVTLAAPVVSAQAVPGDTVRNPIGVRLISPLGLPALRRPLALDAPWARPLPRSATEIGNRFDLGVQRRVDSLSTAAAFRRSMLALFRERRSAELLGLDATPVEDRGLFGLSTSVVDLTFDGLVRFEISTERVANLRCTPALIQDPLAGCRPKFRAPRIDNQVELRSSGLIGQRVRVNVDLNTARDYANSNDVSVSYRGLEDEVLKRIEVGSVQFRPPPSRFLTSGIPSNNFGLSATMEYGPLEVQALAATQKGSVVSTRTYRVGDATTQPQSRYARDLDYEARRFFWTIDPRTIPGYPAIDALTLRDQALGDRPVEVRVYRYRSAAGNIGTNPNLEGITALGVNAEGTLTQRVGPLRWEPLVLGRDYWLDPSGLWFALTSKLDPNDFLAVSYRTQSGTVVGTFPSADNPARSDTLLLVLEPNRGPEAGTFYRTMRNVYRVAGGELVRSSVNIAIQVNRSESPPPPIQAATWLALFGIAVPTDQAVFDVENRLFPRTRDPAADQTIRDYYVIFPNAEPFGDATKIPVASLRNDSLYRTPEYLLFSEGPASRFQLLLEYTASGSGDRSSINLNALQMLEGSEQLEVDGRRLRRGLDYSVSSGTGIVTFLDPEGLFGRGAAIVTARFEERGFFAVAPTSIVGFSARYNVGLFGAFHVVGLYQSEATAFTRPPLGFEPTSSLIGGVRGDFLIPARNFSRWLSRITSTPANAPSELQLNGELAFTRPSANRSGDAFLEEFENDGGQPISLRESSWQFGSRPQSAAGVPFFPAGFDSTAAVQLIWQNLVPGPNGALELRPTDIDTNIVVQSGNNPAPETVMFLTFHADTAGGVVQRNRSSNWSLPAQPFTPRWRSMVTPLSLTGADLSRNEFLEFWVFEPFDKPIATTGMKFIVDVGSVSEDALALAPTAFTIGANGDTTYTGRQYPGAGRLDTERNPTGTFNAVADDIGILGDRPDQLLGPNGLVQRPALCQRRLSNSVDVFPWGDLSARCSNGNGTLDTEDLNGDLLLNARGPGDDVFRYVVDLTDPKYRVRSGVVTQDPNDPTRQAEWVLYRIPLRSPDLQVGQPNIRLVQHIRFTFATPPDDGTDKVVRFAMARMRLTGAPWIRRSATPIAGIAGSTGQPRGDVNVSVVSTENIELGYTSPPGVRNASANVNITQGSLGQQINEKSLRVVARDFRPGDRAEAYLRFVAGPQNLLAYRQLRVWTRGYGDGWDDGQLRAFVKVGTDDQNFYFYSAEARTNTWEPEMVVELETWRRLRAEVEQSFLRGEAPNGASGCGGDPLAYVRCEDGYIVHVRDPAVSPPNLAAVQELSGGIYRPTEGLPLARAELWIDDVRLTSPINETGIAGGFDARLVASDVANLSASYVYTDGQFRQIGQSPSYRTSSTLSTSGAFNIHRFLPPSLGLNVPLVVGYVTQLTDPQLITGSDVRGEALTGLRRPSSNAASWSLQVSRPARDGSLLTRALLNPLTLQTSGTVGGTTTELSEAETNLWSHTATWSLINTRRFARLPLGGLVNRLPRWVRESEGGRAIRNAALSYVPSNVFLQSNLSRAAGEYTSFLVPIRRVADTLAIPVNTLQHLWRNNARTTWQPLGMLTVSGDWQSTRDLREYDDSTSLGRLVGESRRGFLGVDAGVERDRSVGSSLALTPRIASWLQPRLTSTSFFLLSRNLTARNPVRIDGDTAGAFILPQTLNNSRLDEVGVTVDPALVLRRVFGDSSSTARYFDRFRTFDISRTRNRQSTFDLASFSPDLGFQLALGGFDSFLSHEGQFAVGATNTHTTNASGGFQLPLGLSATVNYSTLETIRHQRSGLSDFLVSETRQRDWPSGSVAWLRSFRSGPLTLVELRTSVRQREGSNLIPTGAGEPIRTAVESREIQPNGRVVFKNGVNILGRATFTDGRNENGGNVVLSDRTSMQGDVSWSLTLPRSISRLPKRVTTTLTAISSKDISCIERQDEPCITISDLRRIETRGRFAANIVGSVQADLSLGWSLIDVRHLERKISTLSAAISVVIPLTKQGF